MIQPTGDEGRLHSIGCAGKLTQFSETEDGCHMITLTGISRYRFDNEIEGFVIIVVSKFNGVALKRITRFPSRTKNLTEIVFLTYWKILEGEGCQRTGKLFNKQIMNF